MQRSIVKALACVICLTSLAAAAAPGGAPTQDQAGPPGGQHAPRHGDGSRSPAPPAPHANQWYDGAHGHAHYYPNPGWVVHRPPPQSRVVIWGGVNYSFFDGIWYSPGPRGYVVVRPPYGVVVAELPLFRTAVVVGGLTYLYANGVYYREREGGYEVVPTPVAVASPAAGGSPGNNKVFVYPNRGQSAQQQATDEYECHRWAVTQAGFDPTAAATGQSVATTDAARRGDYARASAACLEGRGYTVR
ncbi:MAG: hypothetical protein HY021_16330 [Burkholderiales bacterium]|nr:hypothetical protein [Burkholderiales bacterium]